jgi:glycosyltransferase involved in cell wall biosynthesis
MTSRLRISLVIPAYNEEGHLAACLHSALNQIEPFHEIIVVDNNSSDMTSQIAAQFPGVIVLHEPRQGVVYARDRGFAATTGTLIARIDADTRLPADWTTVLRNIFSEPTVGAVTGSMQYYDIAAPNLFNRADQVLRRYYSAVLGTDMPLQAANMAIRRDVWQATREQLCHQAGLHEDFDLAIHARRLGYRIVFDEQLRAAISYRQAGSSFASFAQYFWLCPRTYAVHGVRRGRHLYPAVIPLISAYPLFRVLYRGYDPVLCRFSLRKLLKNDVPIRVNPALAVE